MLKITTLIALAFASSASYAEDYPARPIKMIVPFAAGGSSDIMARIVAERIREKWGQSVVIENRVGAGGTLGADAVAKAVPDGYTLLLGTSATQAISPSIYPKLAYDPEKDFRPITLVASIPLVLTSSPSFPAKSVKELIERAKKDPGAINFASSGAGSITHLSSEMFAAMSGIKLTHVPYRGSAPAVTDLLGGRIDFMIDHVPTVLEHIKAGKLTALAVADSERLKDLPDTPTIAESGVPGYQVDSWVGILAPQGTPDKVITALNEVIVEAIQAPAAVRQLAMLGARARTSSPDEFQAVIESDKKKWAGIVAKSGLKVD